MLVGCGESKEEKAAKAKAVAEEIIDAQCRRILKEEGVNKPTGELTKADLEKVWSLSLGDKQLTEVPKGLEKLTRLRQLGLSKNQITDLQPLSGFMELEDLRLSDNPITDLTPLSGLKELENLELSHTLISDLTPLSGLEELEDLDLSHTLISDLTPLVGLKKLKKLNLNGNPNISRADCEKLEEALPRCIIGDLTIGEEAKITWTKKVKYFLEKNGGLIVFILSVLSWVLVKKKIIMKTTVIWTHVLLVIGYFFYFFLTMNRFTPSGFEPPTIWETIWDMFWLVICPLLCFGSFMACFYWLPGGKGKGGRDRIEYYDNRNVYERMMDHVRGKKFWGDRLDPSVPHDKKIIEELKKKE